MTESLSYDAYDKKIGITLGELDDIIHSARRAGASKESRIRISIGWSQQIQRIHIEHRQDPVALWPVVSFTYDGETWVLPNLANAPIGMVAAVHSGDANDFLKALEGFVGKEFVEMITRRSLQEYEEIMLAWEKASSGE